MRRGLCIAGLMLATCGVPVHAQERNFCANRPGLGTPSCTLAPGSAMLEAGIAEWDHSSGGGSTEEGFTFGDALVRIGVSDSAEVELGLTGLRVSHSRKAVSVTRSSAVGDATLAVRRGIAGANGPAAIEGFLSAPADHLGRWSGGVLLPLEFDLPAGFQLALTPEFDWSANASGSGRHAGYGGVMGLSHDVATGLSLAGEIGAWQDDDPDGHSLEARFAASLACQVSPRLQLDVEADAGLSADAPDVALMFGLAKRFR